jgi:hypothetical protein
MTMMMMMMMIMMVDDDGETRPRPHPGATHTTSSAPSCPSRPQQTTNNLQPQ